jgi:hypothetical protein
MLGALTMWTALSAHAEDSHVKGTMIMPLINELAVTGREAVVMAPGAATRRILKTGSEISYMDELTDAVFNRYLMDLGANVLVVVVLIVAVYVSRRALLPAMAEKTGVALGNGLKGERIEPCAQATDGHVRFKKEYA